MKADYLTYRQATGVSLLGMVIQGVLAAGLLIYAILGRDHTAMTLAGYSAWGIVIWLALAIVYDQHRRERIESLEAEALASSPMAGTSVFDGKGDEFRPAQRRLMGLYRYFLPAVSIATALALGLLGYWRFQAARDHVAIDNFIRPTLQGWGIALGLSAALVGFLLARYAAGLAKHKAYANLRAGAAVSVGTALFGLALGVSHFIDSVRPDTAARYMQVIVPGALVALGAEALLNFILSIYRPRRTGELPRPAFDSRLLGFIAAPDRIAQSISDAINYQLGFDVTGGWFYKLLSRSVAPLLGLGALVVWLMSALAVVQPHQQAVVLRFGSPIRTIGPGLHLKAPWPVDSIYVPELFVTDAKGRRTVEDYTATGVRRLDLATMNTATADALLWTNDHSGDEVYQFVRPGGMRTDAPGSGSADALGSTDLAMVSVEIPLLYTIDDVRLFDELAAPERRDDLLKTVARREVTRFFQTVSLDQVLGGDRAAMAAALQARIDAAFKALNPGPDGRARGAGVRVVSVRLLGAHPPKETATAYEGVVQADQRREAALDAARAQAIRSLTGVVGNVDLARSLVAAIDQRDSIPGDQRAAHDQHVEALLDQAGGEAASLLAQARAERWEAHMRAKGRAARQDGQVRLFEAAPDVYRSRTYFDTLTGVLQTSRVYVMGEGVGRRIHVDMSEKAMGSDLFNSER